MTLELPEEGVKDRCERCRKRMRHLITVPYVGTWWQDWYFDPKTRKTRRVAEIDEDVCAPCGEKIIAACEAYYAVPV